MYYQKLLSLQCVDAGRAVVNYDDIVLFIVDWFKVACDLSANIPPFFVDFAWLSKHCIYLCYNPDLNENDLTRNVFTSRQDLKTLQVNRLNMNVYWIESGHIKHGFICLWLNITYFNYFFFFFFLSARVKYREAKATWYLFLSIWFFIDNVSSKSSLWLDIDFFYFRIFIVDVF